MADYIEPPADVLLNVIPPHVRDEWRTSPTPELNRRLEILSASGPMPSEQDAAIRLIHRRAKRAAWETYVRSAFICGFFEGQRGVDLRARLADQNPDNFRAAMAECMTCWFLGGRLRLPVVSHVFGRGNKMLDMGTVIDSRNVGVEVKAPYRETPSHVWEGDDSDLISQCLDSANKQFGDALPNILTLAPILRTPVSLHRGQLVSALYGNEKIVCPINTLTGEPLGPIRTEFFPEGKLLRRRLPDGRLVKPNGMPGFTRVSAVIVIEEDYRYGTDNQCWIEHSVFVAHNMHASHPLNTKTFEDFVQFTDVGNGYGWSDGGWLT